MNQSWSSYRRYGMLGSEPLVVRKCQPGISVNGMTCVVGNVSFLECVLIEVEGADV